MMAVEALLRDPSLANQATVGDASRLLAGIAAVQVTLGAVQATLLARICGGVDRPPSPQPVQNPPSQPSPYLRAGEIIRRLGVCRATLWKWRRKGLFPEPVNLGPNVCAWPAEVVKDWEERAAARLPQVGDWGGP